MTSNNRLGVSNHLAGRNDRVVSVMRCCRVRSYPVISALNWPTAAISGPSFTPIVPTGSSGLLWNPIIASTPSSTPSEINARAHGYSLLPVGK